ncbi:hypothetical protein GCM10022409_18040 [Hymenobacter glaciei]|uniref:Secretion system C-terminal sorting domain-containing protein n=1 Tax=Hymenobacter glaciei TaxID=877209 RepID=A0ABP7U0H3_9BACT
MLGLLFSGSFHLALPDAGSHEPGWLAEREGEDKENDGDEVRPDRPDLALLQDMDRTRDPATGTVPTERLLAAARFNEKFLQNAAQRGTATTGLESASWTERGPNNVGGRVLAMLFDPADVTGSAVFAGTANGGLWKITNATTGTYTWSNVSSGLSNLAVSALAADASVSPAIIYAGTGEGFFNADAVRGGGIFKSTDGGVTWAVLPATVSNPDFLRCQKLVVHPVTHDVYAATRNGGLYRSQDKGVTWTQVLNTTTAQASVSTRVADIEIAADNTIFVTMGLFATDGIYRSATGNVSSWTKLNTLSGSGLPTTGYNRIELACAPSDANRLFAIFENSATNGLLDIYRSLNKGNTWTVMPKPGGSSFDYTSGQAWYAQAAAVSPINPDLLYVGGLDLYVTANASAATPIWTKKSAWNVATTSTNYVHADHHEFLFLPGSGSEAISASDGGLAYTATATAATTTFSQRNTNFNVTQFYAVAMHPTNYNYFLAGAQDNGTRQFTTAGINSTPQISGGDGGYCTIDQNAPTNQISSYVYNQYYRTTDGWSTSTQLFLSGTTGSFINPWDFDSSLNVLYAGNTTNTYLAWTNPMTANNAAGASTIAPALPANSGDVSFVGIAPLTAKRIYLGTNASSATDGGTVLMVDNANTATPTITKIFPGTVNTAVSCVAVDPANEAHVLVTLSNYGVVSVYESTNATAATPTWTSVEGNLPDMPVRWALFDPRGTSKALLATEMGIYSTDKLNGSSTVWKPTANGPLNMRVDMLRYRTGDKTVAAATHGRGLFTSAMFALPLPVTLTSLSAARQSSGALVRWQTASEQHSLRFEVERSVNAVDYQRIGTVAAAGSSSSALTYTLPDATAGLGTYYYRLRQVDTDGTITYSAPVALAAAAGAGNALLSSVYPNPFRADLSVELREPATGRATLDLVDAQGRRAWASTVAATGRQLHAEIPAALAPGTYVLTVRANGQVAHRRVVKQ